MMNSNNIDGQSVEIDPAKSVQQQIENEDIISIGAGTTIHDSEESDSHSENEGRDARNLRIKSTSISSDTDKDIAFKMVQGTRIRKKSLKKDEGEEDPAETIARLRNEILRLRSITGNIPGNSAFSNVNNITNKNKSMNTPIGANFNGGQGSSSFHSSSFHSSFQPASPIVNVASTSIDVANYAEALLANANSHLRKCNVKMR
jgi:hypothetical protein